MYSGQIMEAADIKTLFAQPSHPYTQGLLASLPEMATEGATELAFIPGQPPVSGQIKEGCPFRTRCSQYMPGTCERPLPTVWLSEKHRVRCHLYGEATAV